MSCWKELQKTGELCSSKTSWTDTRLERHVILTCYEMWFSWRIFSTVKKIYNITSSPISHTKLTGAGPASGPQFADPGAKTRVLMPCASHWLSLLCSPVLAHSECSGRVRGMNQEREEEESHRLGAQATEQPTEAQETRETCLGPH